MNRIYKWLLLLFIVSSVFFSSVSFSTSTNPRDKLLDSIKLELELKYNEWHINQAIDEAVDESIEKIKRKTGYWEKIVSKFSSKKAREFAKIIGELIFANDKLNKRLSDYLSDVFKDVHSIVLDSISELYIVKIKKIGIDIKKRYGLKVEDLFFKTVKYRNYMFSKEKKLPVNFTTVDILKEHIPQGVSIASGIILLFEQKMIIDKISSYLEGTIFKKVNVNILQTSLRIVNWALIVVPIVYEFITPDTTILEIARQYKSFKVKDRIREGFINYILNQIDALYPEIILMVEKEIDNVLNDFQRGNRRLLECYDKIDGFRKFVDTLTPQGFNNVVLFIGKTNLDLDHYANYLKDKTLYEIANIPPSSFNDFLSLVEAVGTYKALKWYRKTSNLHTVLTLKLYNTFDPDRITSGTLKRLLSFGDSSLVDILKTIDPHVLSLLFDAFSNEEIRDIVTSRYYDPFMRFARSIKGGENLRYLWSLFTLYPSNVMRDKDTILVALERDNTQRGQRRYLERLDRLYHWENALGLFDIPFLKRWIVKLFASSSFILGWVVIIIGILIFLIFIKMVWKIFRFLIKFLIPKNQKRGDTK